MFTEEELVTESPVVADVKVSLRMLTLVAPLMVMMGPNPPPEIMHLAVSVPEIETFLFKVSVSV
jgi:hypothetical protein